MKYFLTGVLVCLVLPVFLSAQGTPLEWEGLSGKSSEFLVYMPKGYLTNARGEMYIGSPRGTFGGTRVKRQVTGYRLVNRVVLMFDYFEGNGPEIQQDLSKRKNLAEKRTSDYGTFQMKEFSGPHGKHFSKVQYFFNDDRLYVLTAIAPNLNHGIVKAFFESARLTTLSGPLAPNAIDGATTTSIPAFLEQVQERSSDESAMTIAETDRGPIIIYHPPPRFGINERRGIGSGSLKLKVLLSSSGKVSSVEVVSTPSKLLENSAKAAAEKTVFIPAEKDGRLVSTYQTFESSFNVGPR